MEQFEKWLKFTQDGWVKDIEGNVWPSFGGLVTRDEAECAKDGWRAALEWVLTHKKPIKYRDYKFDYIKTDVIDEELNATSEKRC